MEGRKGGGGKGGERGGVKREKEWGGGGWGERKEKLGEEEGGGGAGGRGDRGKATTAVTLAKRRSIPRQGCPGGRCRDREPLWSARRRAAGGTRGSKIRGRRRAPARATAAQRAETDERAADARAAVARRPTRQNPRQAPGPETPARPARGGGGGPGWATTQVYPAQEPPNPRAAVSFSPTRNSDGSLGRTCEASMWCARVAICQHRLEYLAGSME